MNEFSRQYAGFDFKKGTFDLIGEITVRKGKIDGYVKPSFRDLQVFSWEKDVKEKQEDMGRLFRQATLGVAFEVVKNQSKNEVSTRIPIIGTIENPDADIGSTVINVLQNAFVKAFMPKTEKR